MAREREKRGAQRLRQRVKRRQLGNYHTRQKGSRQWQHERMSRGRADAADSLVLPRSFKAFPPRRTSPTSKSKAVFLPTKQRRFHPARSRRPQRAETHETGRLAAAAGRPALSSRAREGRIAWWLANRGVETMTVNVSRGELSTQVQYMCRAHPCHQKKKKKKVVCAPIYEISKLMLD